MIAAAPPPQATALGKLPGTSALPPRGRRSHPAQALVGSWRRAGPACRLRSITCNPLVSRQLEHWLDGAGLCTFPVLIVTEAAERFLDTWACRTGPRRDRRSLAMALANCHDIVSPTAPVTRSPSRTRTMERPSGATATGQPLDTSAFLRAEQALVADEGQPATTADCRNLGQGSPALHTKRQHGRSDTHKTAHDPIRFTFPKMSSLGCISGSPRAGHRSSVDGVLISDTGGLVVQCHSAES